MTAVGRDRCGGNQPQLRGPTAIGTGRRGGRLEAARGGCTRLLESSAPTAGGSKGYEGDSCALIAPLSPPPPANTDTVLCVRKCPKGVTQLS